MSTVRLRRLAADFTKLSDYVRLHPRVRLIQSDGDPPESYQLEYRVTSLRQVDGELETVESHIVEIHLPRNYPRTPPQCRMLTPVFHPNIAPHTICVGDHWSAGESLQGIVTRIGEMLAYQSYNVKSPLNGEAARWAEENESRLPLDTVSLLPEEHGGEGAATATVQATRPAAPTKLPASTPERMTTSAEANAGKRPSSEPKVVACPDCGTRLRLPSDRVVKKVRCRSCRSVFEVSADAL